MDTNLLDMSRPSILRNPSPSCPNLWSGISTITTAATCVSPSLPTIAQEHLLVTTVRTPISRTQPIDVTSVNKSTSMDSFSTRRRRSPSPRDPSKRMSQPVGRQDLEDAMSDSSNNNSQISFGNANNDRKPTVPQRKPRMGQSSLSPSSVLPVTSSSSPSRFDIHNNNRGSSPGRLSPNGTMRSDENSNPATVGVVTEGIKRIGRSQDSFRNVAVYQETTNVKGATHIQHESQPPPLPRKRTVHEANMVNHIRYTIKDKHL